MPAIYKTFSWQTKLMKYTVDEAMNVTQRLGYQRARFRCICVTDETLNSITKQRASEENSFKFNTEL